MTLRYYHMACGYLYAAAVYGQGDELWHKYGGPDFISETVDFHSFCNGISRLHRDMIERGHHHR